jgi:hypothetical protein
MPGFFAISSLPGGCDSEPSRALRLHHHHYRQFSLSQGDGEEHSIWPLSLQYMVCSMVGSIDGSSVGALVGSIDGSLFFDFFCSSSGLSFFLPFLFIFFFFPLRRQMQT